MQTNAVPPRYRIVVAVDGSEYSHIVLEHALDQAARHDAPDVHVLRVVAPGEPLDPIKSWLATAMRDVLDAFRGGGPDCRSRLHVRTGTPADEIVDFAGEVDADLLVIGCYGLRSVADRVVRRAPCPTLVVGLAGHALEAEPACPDCVAIRERTDGEAWFCSTHGASDGGRLSVLVPWSSSPLHGGPLW